MTEQIVKPTHLRFKDLTGRIFGKLTADEYAGRGRGGESRWRCRCECGMSTIATSRNLLNGHSRSCGCARKEALKKVSITHGKSQSKEYGIWNAMKNRCYNNRVDRYQKYGGRGIAVCDRWLESFENFYADMGPRPTPKHSIDRINNDGNYEPGNCRWATDSEQRRNKTSTVHVTVNGTTKTIAEWAVHHGIKAGTIRERIKRGWSMETALSKNDNRYKDMTIAGAAGVAAKFLGAKSE